VTANTYYRWKAKYAGMDVNEAKRLKTLEDENRRLKQLVAQQALDNQILRKALGKD
jgi:putative transposase